MNTLFLVALVVQAAFGLGFVLVPAWLMAPFGVTLDEVSTVFARLFGSALLALAVLLAGARRVHEPWFRRVMVSAQTVYFALSLVVIMLALLARLMNPFGWALALLQAVLLVWFLVFARRAA